MNPKIIDRCITDLLENGMSLDQCLQKYPGERDELEPILRVALSLISAQRLTASAQFKRTGWIRIQNQISTRHIPKLSEVKENRTGLKFLWTTHSVGIRLAFAALMILVFISVAFSGVIVASAASLPGDWLYPAKLQVERVQLALAQPGLESAAFRLELATRRLTEADELIKQDRSIIVDEVITSYKNQVQSVFTSLEAEGNMTPEDRSVIFLLLKDWYSTNKNHLEKILISIPDIPIESVSQTNDFSRLTQDRVIKLFQQYPYLLYTLPEVFPVGSTDEPGLNEMSVITSTEVITPSIVVKNPAVSNDQGFKLPTKYFPDDVEEEYLLEKLLPLVSTYFPDEPLLFENGLDLENLPRLPGKKDMEDFPGFDFPLKWPELFPDDSEEP
jgi:hypothetical protein